MGVLLSEGFYKKLSQKMVPRHDKDCEEHWFKLFINFSDSQLDSPLGGTISELPGQCLTININKYLNIYFIIFSFNFISIVFI